MSVINHSHPFLQATNIAEKAATRLAIPVNPISNLMAALLVVLEGVWLAEVFDPDGVTEALVDVAVGLGREILLKVIVAAPGIGTVTDALAP